MAITGKTIAELDSLASPTGGELLVVQVGSENKKVTVTAVAGVVDTTYEVANSNADGLMSSAHYDKLAGIDAGATKNSAGTNVTIDASGVISATDTTYTNATTSVAGLLSASDKTKLDGIAANATANSADSYLLDRNNHTGSQPIGSITGLSAALTNKLEEADLEGTSILSTSVSSGKVLIAQGDGTSAWGTVSAENSTGEDNVQSDWNESNNASDAYIKNKPTLATVATSGSYADLSGKPTKLSDFSNDAGFVTTDTTYTAGTNVSITDGVISATDTTYSPATDLVNGLMSAADKSKLDNIEEGAASLSAGTNIEIDAGFINATIPRATASLDGGLRANLVGTVLYLTNNGVNA